MKSNKTNGTNAFLFLCFYIAFCYDFYIIMLKGFRGFASFNFPYIFLYALIAVVISLFAIKKMVKHGDIWMQYSKAIFGINVILVSYILFLTISNFNNTSGLECALWRSTTWRGWAGVETHYYIQPFVGYIGLVITILTYLQIQLTKKKIGWTMLLWLPQLVYLGILLIHFFLIKKPVFYG
ncbi:MAG: hypothetical protein AB8G11_13775 [Saprospiraceae bacterium]